MAELGLRTFLETFAAQNRPEDIRAYVTRAYGEEQQLRELEDPSCTVLVGEVQDVAVAYALLRRAFSPACVISELPIEISRFYVSKELHGFGVAQDLMVLAIKTVRDLGGRAAWRTGREVEGLEISIRQRRPSVASICHNLISIGIGSWPGPGNHRARKGRTETQRHS